MKLSQLVYECVVNSINIPNTDVNYYSFLNGDLKNNKDYVNQITSVFSALNLSLSRLLNSNKIPYKTEYVEISPTTKNSIYFDKGKVINIVKLLPNGDYERFRFRTLNSKEYLIYD